MKSTRTMEITTKMGCSINCRYCPQKKLLDRYYKENKDRESIMSYDKYKGYIDMIPRDVEIHFSGMCEPWLNPHCTDMVEYAESRGHIIDIYTTLVGMTINDYYRIRELKLHYFVLHVPDQYGNSNIKIDDDYIELLKVICEDVRKGKFSIKKLSVQGTIHQKIWEIVSDLGLPVNSEIFDRAGNVDIDENVCVIENMRKGPIVCKYCMGVGLGRNVLLPDGTVLLCCMDYGMEHILGNLNTDTYEEISNGIMKREYRKQLRSLKNGMIICRNCHVAENIYRYYLIDVPPEIIHIPFNKLP